MSESKLQVYLPCGQEASAEFRMDGSIKGHCYLSLKAEAKAHGNK